jgi:hypothetical protein
VHHLADRAEVAERAEHAEERHHVARIGLVGETDGDDPEQRPGDARAERPGEAGQAAVHHRVQRGGADQAVGDPGREAERRAAGAQQKRVEVEVVELRARRALRVARAVVREVRVAEELQREQRPGERPGAALP